MKKVYWMRYWSIQDNDWYTVKSPKTTRGQEKLASELSFSKDNIIVEYGWHDETLTEVLSNSAPIFLRILSNRI